MKIKTTRVCARKGCVKEFRMYRTTDKYCCPACAYDSQKNKPKPKAKPIKRVSDKRKKENIIYSKKRKTFLAKPENKYCLAAKIVFNEEILTNQIHHKAGRKGKLLNYVPFWLAASQKGHDWIHANPKEAYKLGLLIRSTTVKI